MRVSYAVNRAIFYAICVTGLSILFSFLFATQASADNHKVTICHATSSQRRPFIEIGISTIAWELAHDRLHLGDVLLPGEACEEPPDNGGPPPEV